MVKRELDGQGGLAARNGWERMGWHWWVDPWTKRGAWKRDADDLLRRVNSLQEKDGDVGAYVSPFATLGADTPGRGRSTKPRIPPGDSS